jgi:oxygen-dependent protoporphyrinogen oxidase
MTASGKRIVIVGGGISGLATAVAIEDQAQRLGLLCPEIVILEAAEHPGGKIRTVRSGPYPCESGVDGFLNKEPATLALCERLGLAPRLLPATQAFNKRYLYARGKLHAVEMSPLKFLSSPLLSPWAKARLALEPFIPRGPARAANGTDQSLADFARRRIGHAAYRTLIDPMQTGIYAGDPERMSAAACFPRAVEVVEQYGSLVRGMVKINRARKRNRERETTGGPSGHLTSFDHGMQVLVDGLSEVLAGRIRCGTEARQIVKARDGSFQIKGSGLGSGLRADVLVLACPAYVMARLLEPHQPMIAEALRAIDYPPVGVLCLAYPRHAVGHPLDGFGFLAARGQGLRALGVLFTSSIYRGRAPDGTALLRVMVGGMRDPGILSESDEVIFERIQHEVAQVLGVVGRPIFRQLFRHDQAIPQYGIGHLSRLRDTETALSGLKNLVLTGNALHGVSVNDCVKNAKDTADRTLRSVVALD